VTEACLLNEFAGVLEQVLPFVQFDKGVDGQNGIFAHCGIPMLQARQDRGNEGLQNLLLLNATQEAQRCSSQELIRVLKVVAQVLADQNLQECLDYEAVQQEVCTCVFKSWWSSKSCKF